MIEIKPNILYTRADLAALLGPAGVDVDYFIARVKPRKFLRMVWLGEDLLAAMRAAPSLADREECGGGAAVLEALAATTPPPDRRQAAGNRPADKPAGALRALRQELKKELR